MKTQTSMKSAIEKILFEQKQLEAFQQNEHFAIKIENEPFMPLSIEKHGNLVTVTHYYEQNGDLVPDPDMEFVDLGHGDWLPVTIQHATGHYVRSGVCDDGVWKFNARTTRELESFSKLWARNLLAQGFATGALIYAKPT